MLKTSYKILLITMAFSAILAVALGFSSLGEGLFIGTLVAMVPALFMGD